MNRLALLSLATACAFHAQATPNPAYSTAGFLPPKPAAASMIGEKFGAGNIPLPHCRKPERTARADKDAAADSSCDEMHRTGHALRRSPLTTNR
jgi:hypothetical protein